MEHLLKAVFLGLGMLLFTSCANPRSGYFVKLKHQQSLETFAHQMEVPMEDLQSANDNELEKVLRQGRLVYVPFQQKRGILDGANMDFGIAKLWRGIFKSNDMQFLWPIENRKRLVSEFGERRKKGRIHEGIDLAAKPGTAIVASQNGRVSYSGWLRGYGRIVILTHDDGYQSLYAHNSKNLVKKGQWVKAGAKIAKVGSSGRSTGPHLHFEIRKGTDPLDPLDLLPSM